MHLVPRYGTSVATRNHTEQTDAAGRRFEIIETNGTMRRLEMSNLRPNVTLADNLFQFTPPPGAQVYEP